ncbi:MAG: HAMP domain-containing histidine kinase [candidate division KSB1 bacterium]|nr:HAMP domain-containing histidine kinase [candidate division KSB1 bacterium]MDZ7357007.1 HAMP domain-containing histidine kinase [candidate division KSB1 bacterium]MDZ7398676.1 HAMP domain-containing histidine kinase [candidate division KSB1 bacterium]
MKKKIPRLIRPVVVLIAVQFVWLSLAALWIYFYISNHIIIKNVGDQLSPALRPGSYHVLVLIFGCILLVLLQAGFYFIYIYLNRQLMMNRVQDQFITTITHELKSPLASIQLCLETIQARAVPPQKLHEFTQLMMRDVYRLQGVIDGILGAISIDQKRLAFEFKVYNTAKLIPKLINEVIARYPEEITSRISFNTPPRCRCVIDKNSLKLVFNNLVDNAVKYAAGNFVLQIKSSRTDKYFRIEFIDQGTGIPASERKRVFGKFYRVTRKQQPNISGTGLGLYITREIVKYHGGRVKALSPENGLGTLIQLELPIYKQSHKRYINRLLKETIKRKKRIEQAT